MHIDNHTGLCSLGFAHVTDLSIIHRHLGAVFCSAVVRRQHSGLFQGSIAWLSAPGHNDRMGTGDILGMQPNVIVIGLFLSQFIILPIIAAH